MSAGRHQATPDEETNTSAWAWTFLLGIAATILFLTAAPFLYAYRMLRRVWHHLSG